MITRIMASFTKEEEASIQELKDIQSRMGFTSLTTIMSFGKRTGKEWSCSVLRTGGRVSDKVGFDQGIERQWSGQDFLVLMSHDPTHFELQIMDGKAAYRIDPKWTYARHANGH